MSAISQFALSLVQRDVYFDQLHLAGTAKYTIGGYIDIESAEPSRLAQAHRLVMATHPMFRLRLSHTATGPVLSNDADQHDDLRVIDLRRQSDAVVLARAEIQRLFAEPFALEQPRLYQAYQILLPENRIWFVGLAHHLIIDGWGFANWANALAQAYSSGTLSCEAGQLTEYFADDQLYQQSSRQQKDAEFWQHYLRDSCRTVLERRAVQTSASGDISSARYRLPIERAQYQRWLSADPAFAESPHSLMLALTFICFARLTGQHRFCIGVPAHNRTMARQKQMIALYTSVSPVVLQLDESLTFLQFLQQVKQQQQKVYRHQKFPIGKMVDLLGPEARKGLFDIGVNYLKLNNSCRFASAMASYQYIENPYQTTPFNLTVWDNGEVQPVEWQIDYHLQYFSADTLAECVTVLQRLMMQVVANPAILLSELSLLSPDWQAPSVTPGLVPTLLQQFELHARSNPQQIAIHFNSQCYRYGQLDLMANALALQLHNKQIQPGDRVALLFGRSPVMPIAMLAAHKIGAAFIPMDPGYPLQRLQLMLEDSQATILLTAIDWLELSVQLSAEALLVDMDALTDAAMHQPVTPARQDSASQSAYVLYTSGSTGRPKGVEISEQALANFLASMAEKPGLQPCDLLLAVTPFSFDISLLEVLLPLYLGATVRILPQALSQDLPALLAALDSPDVRMVQMTPSAWKLVLASGWAGRADLIALTGGEALPAYLASELMAKTGRLWNMYGPTETTIWSSCIEVTPHWLPNSIGYPIARTGMQILDAQLRPLPDGWPGALYICGQGLALGYLHQPVLTAEKFIQWRGQRWYQTGDVAIRQPDGQFVFVGREDLQLKYLGYRIEPGEIEAAVRRYPEVEDAVVQVRTLGAGRQALLAYYQAKQPLDPSLLRAALSQALPPQMMPSLFIHLTTFPLTPSGKRDLKALPLPAEAASAATSGLPSDHLMRELLQLIRTHLQLLDLTEYTNLFDAGARSQDMIELAQQISEHFARPLSVVDLFANPSVHRLAAHWQQQQPAGIAPSAQAEKIRDGRMRLQQRFNTRKQVDAV